jgi:hypothetical protein
MIRLIIKGNFEEARAALDARKLGTCMMLVAVREDETDVAEVDAVVHDTDAPAVVAWFCEPGSAPFPPGTLLYYSAYPGSK